MKAFPSGLTAIAVVSVDAAVWSGTLDRSGERSVHRHLSASKAP